MPLFVPYRQYTVQIVCVNNVYGCWNMILGDFAILVSEEDYKILSEDENPEIILQKSYLRYCDLSFLEKRDPNSIRLFMGSPHIFRNIAINWNNLIRSP